MTARFFRSFIAAIFVVTLASGSATQAPPPPAYDVIIRGGRVLDGAGNPFVYTDVGIKGDTIASIGDLQAAAATRIVDARGQYVTPGFIALHAGLVSRFCQDALRTSGSAR